MGVFGSMAKVTVTVAALAAGICLAAPSSRASYYGDAEWCAVTFGDDTHWDCEFRTGEECMQALAGGHRGCNVNPYWRGPSAATPSNQPERRTRRR